MPTFLPSLPPLGPNTALCKASLPYLSAYLKSISGCWSKNSTTLYKPKKLDLEKGVLPKAVLAFMLAPFDCKYLITCNCPKEQA